MVVDLAAGDGWAPDSLVNAFSVGKGLTAAVLGHVMETAGVALDDPVTDWWPELDLGLSVAQLASHQAGLPALREPQPEFVMYDWDAMVAALAATEPWWAPGTAHGYHTNTFGFLVGEVVRRASGRSVGTILRELAAPLEADVFIGLPDEEHARVVPFHFPESMGGFGPPMPANEHELMIRNGYANPPGLLRASAWSTRRSGGGPRSPRPTVTPAPAAWPASTPGSSMVASCRRRRWPPSPKSGPMVSISCSSARPASAPASSCPSPSALRHRPPGLRPLRRRRLPRLRRPRRRGRLRLRHGRDGPPLAEPPEPGPPGRRVQLSLTVPPEGQVRRSRHCWRMAWLRAWSARPGWLVQRATATRASGSRVK